jgi:glycosyltransferase involved in cell wall biosynthesis
LKRQNKIVDWLIINKIIIIFFWFLFLNSNVCADKKNIALCSVATGKYAFFVKDFIEGARKNFLPNHNVTFYIFTDQLLPVSGNDLVVVRWPHKKWPFSTMMRFQAYHNNFDLLGNNDYIFACDIDLGFVDIIGDEILGNLVGVLHPGYYQKNLIKSDLINRLIETRTKSKICLNHKNCYKKYFAGGFYGGKTNEFKKLVSICLENITHDLKLNLIAPWHDETHLNYYFLKCQPNIILGPDYCFPEKGLANKNIKLKSPKILALNKDHLSIRKSRQILDDREFVILIPSYNNIAYYKQNLDSVYQQNYNKYRVIYIDDCSPDGTGEAVEKYAKACNRQNITKVIRNKDRVLAMANIYHNIHKYCYDHEIVVMLDGDDQLSNENVLSRLNYEYKNNDIWFTHGSCFFIHEKAVCSWSKEIPNYILELNNFRKQNLGATHLRTFYAWLFKKIKIEDLKYQNDFFKMTYDVAMFIPMIEMAGYHHKFIKDILYLYNDLNPINDHKINQSLQREIDRYIRKNMIKYQPTTKLDFFDKVLNLGFYNSGNIRLEEKIEIAAILNDLIAGLYNVYGEKDVFDILRCLAFLKDNFVNQNNLLLIAKEHDYKYLSSYLMQKI